MIENCRRGDCPRCQEVKAMRARHNLGVFVAEHCYSLLFVTLTTLGSYDPLGRQVRSLFDAFTALRRRAAWSNAIVGGVRAVDTTYDPVCERWHPHLHVLAEGWPTTLAEIGAAWARLTGAVQSDLQVVEPEGMQAVVAYVSKPAIRSLWNQADRLAEWAAAMKGLRPRQTFDSFRAVKLYRKRPSTSPPS